MNAEESRIVLLAYLLNHWVIQKSPLVMKGYTVWWFLNRRCNGWMTHEKKSASVSLTRQAYSRSLCVHTIAVTVSVISRLFRHDFCCSATLLGKTVRFSKCLYDFLISNSILYRIIFARCTKLNNCAICTFAFLLFLKQRP